jgi:hypothetical protein
MYLSVSKDNHQQALQHRHEAVMSVDPGVPAVAVWLIVSAAAAS